MFPRKKKNKTGTISVVVIDKSHGYKEVKNFGVVKTDVEADQKKSAAVTDWILSQDKVTGVFHEYKRDNGERW